jgi:mono/diheme cytochrome c family protein
MIAVSITARAHAGQSDSQEFSQIERGRYLSVLSDCASCHTVPGRHQPFAGGRAIETPFGNIIAPNITPDRETGIGAWSDDEFDAAVRQGIGRDGARLYPAMPFDAYTKMSREDVVAIRAYLNTVAPVKNAKMRSLPIPYRFRSIFAPRCACGTHFISTRVHIPQIQKNLPNGIEAHFSSRVLVTVAPATRQKRFWVVITPADSSRARRYRDGSRPTSPMTAVAGSAVGQSTTLRPI